MDTRDRSRQDTPSNGNGRNGTVAPDTAPRADETQRAHAGVVGFFERAVDRVRAIAQRPRGRRRVNTGANATGPYGAYMPGGGTTANPLWSGMRKHYANQAPEPPQNTPQGGWYEGDPYWRPTRPTFERGDDPERFYASRRREEAFESRDARREHGVFGMPDEGRSHWQGRAENQGSNRETYNRGGDEWSYRERDERDRYERAGYGARPQDDARGERPQGRAWGGEERGPWEDRDRERRFGRSGLGYDGSRGNDTRGRGYAAPEQPDNYDYRTQRERDQRVDADGRGSRDADRDFRGRR